jgi:hypothetical protein
VTIKDILDRVEDRHLVEEEVPDLLELLKQGELWKAGLEAAEQGTVDPVGPWWDLLTRKNPDIPVSVYLDNFGAQRAQFGHIGTIAVELLVCATLAALPWDQARAELDRRLGRFPWPPATAELPFLLLARSEFLAAVKTSTFPRDSNLLSGAWPSFVRQQVGVRLDWPAPLSAAWAWDAICQFWGFSRVAHRCVVAVAGYGKPPASMGPGKRRAAASTGDPETISADLKKDTGLLVTLVLETIEGGAADAGIWHDPRDAFLTSPANDLQSSIAETFRIAKSEATGTMAGSAVGGRWRLYEAWDGGNANDETAPRLESCGGTSAGGAALRGWMHALRGWSPDRELIVIAAVDEQLKTLTGLKQEKLADKVHAVVRFNEEALSKRDKQEARAGSPIDTIVVGSHDDAAAAAGTLGQGSDVRVVLFNTNGTFLVDHHGRLTPMTTSET